MANDYAPLQAFEAASGLNATDLRVLCAIGFIAGLLLAYTWAIRKGYGGFIVNGDIFSYLKLILKGAAVLVVAVIFFVY